MSQREPYRLHGVLGEISEAIAAAFETELRSEMVVTMAKQIIGEEDVDVQDQLLKDRATRTWKFKKRDWVDNTPRYILQRVCEYLGWEKTRRNYDLIRSHLLEAWLVSTAKVRDHIPNDKKSRKRTVRRRPSRRWGNRRLRDRGRLAA